MSNPEFFARTVLRLVFTTCMEVGMTPTKVRVVFEMSWRTTAFNKRIDVDVGCLILT